MYRTSERVIWEITNDSSRELECLGPVPMVIVRDCQEDAGLLVLRLKLIRLAEFFGSFFMPPLPAIFPAILAT